MYKKFKDRWGKWSALIGRRIWKDRDGQALVEFAIVLPILLLLLLGMMEFGLLLYNQQVITNASREGARFGIVVRPDDRYTEGEIAAVVDNYCANHMITFGSDTPATIADPHSVSASFQDTLTVEVEFDYEFLVLPNFIGEWLRVTTLRAETTMLYE
jgi:Flp pilus assembly protein TadG